MLIHATTECPANASGAGPNVSSTPSGIHLGGPVLAAARVVFDGPVVMGLKGNPKKNHHFRGPSCFDACPKLFSMQGCPLKVSQVPLATLETMAYVTKVCLSKAWLIS